MSFFKTTTFTVDKDGFELLEPELIKTAAVALPANVQYDPDFIYMWVKGVSSGETWGPNKNDDWFPRAELETSHQTFMTAHVFKNHENKDIKNAIGDILHVKWDTLMDCVKLLIRIDSKIAPSIVRGFEKGYMTDVSMGCRVDHSVCSICGNKAKVPREYCDHVKFERGKIYDDGRRVYEINIGPKFHDISAVLNGAEKTAKVMGIYIQGSKVAFNQIDEMEKVACDNSMVDSFSDRTIGEKVASVSYDSDCDIFPDELLDKKAYQAKVAELQKDIEGKIVSIADQEENDDLVESSDSVRNILKLCCEGYWDDEKCNTVSGMLGQMASERNISKEEVFSQFINVLNFTGCELAPKEFSLIFKGLFDVPDTGENTYQNHDDDENSIHEVRNNCSDLSGRGFGDLIESAVMGSRMGHMPMSMEAPSPVRGITIIAALPKRTMSHSINLTPDLLNMFAESIRSRSMFSPHMLKRASTVTDNKEFFITKEASTESDIVNAMYMVYQNDRCACFGSDDYVKLATDYTENSFMEKTALKYNHLTAATIGLPAIFGYSALQKSRIKNGENISALNKTIAENPANTWLLQSIFGPKLLKGGKKLGKTVGDKSQQAVKSMAEVTGKIKMADFVLGSSMEKIASPNNYNTSIVDEAVLSVYNEKQVNALKIASVMSKMTKDDAAEVVLANSNLSLDDLEGYFKIASSALVNERKRVLLKEANFVSNVGITKIPNDMDFPKAVLYKFKERL